MNALELAEKLHVEWTNDSLNYDTALEAAAMLLKQSEAIKVLRATLTNVIEYYELHPDTAGAAKALQDTEEYK